MIDFVEQVFKLCEAGQLLVLVATEADVENLSGISVNSCIVPVEQSVWFTASFPLIHDDVPVQVSYTSGTEGKPNGILLTYANLADAAVRIIG